MSFFFSLGFLSISQLCPCMDFVWIITCVSCLFVCFETRSSVQNTALCAVLIVAASLVKGTKTKPGLFSLWDTGFPANQTRHVNVALMCGRFIPYISIVLSSLNLRNMVLSHIQCGYLVPFARVRKSYWNAYPQHPSAKARCVKWLQ